MKRFIRTLLITLMCAFIMPTLAYADTGPKPSVNISFSGLDNMTYYVTLLSKTNSTGPYSSYEQDSDRWEEGAENYDVFKKFLSYKDSDGYYFLQFFKKCSNNSTFSWTYYSPSDFKILMYFPEADTFAISGEAYERYAFDSYYNVDCSKLSINTSISPMTIAAERSYYYSGEALSMFARIAITIVIELIIALFFKYRTRSHIAAICITNVVTQSILNLLLNLIVYNKPQNRFIFYYVLLELVVFFIEAMIYSVLFSRWERYGEGYDVGNPAVYSFTANAASFAAGFWLSHLIPGIF